MKETISFFKHSANRSGVLKKVMRTELSGLCETRWVERHKSVTEFRSLLPQIVKTLDFITSWKDVQTASKARILKLALCDSQFIVSIVFVF